MKVDLIQCGPAVSASERKAIEQLKARLIGAPGDGAWRLLANLTFSADHRFQSDEIDIVVVGPPGVRVIEVKHWTAAWVRRNGELVAAQAERVIRKAKKIGTAVRRANPAVGWVDGVFLTHPRFLPGRADASGRAQVLHRRRRGCALRRGAVGRCRLEYGGSAGLRLQGAPCPGRTAWRPGRTACERRRRRAEAPLPESAFDPRQARRQAPVRGPRAGAARGGWCGSGSRRRDGPRGDTRRACRRSRRRRPKLGHPRAVHVSGRPV